mmetsp:Transcript_4421/g.7700  ORF Transcript_4421/g.7700 Transcript_4421/m.7700 type:complete len:750 (-) Transcript_4421:457-2706(-)|eukprot:CAMPEP_0171495786 /NCGR_PEP_ID=MMETSP0958-20121227/6330_1 /TAXON_ID=87120 /ORGANISM="Aurantiochytrium limacinum, Strain ATCCMYA-1381" /LENGTH=749 /DNA_ID=CAMNT_0012029797 /DNA_START=1462 /DNA_END=3711 /DNA_ORIENTATION=-
MPLLEPLMSDLQEDYENSKGKETNSLVSKIMEEDNDGQRMPLDDQKQSQTQNQLMQLQNNNNNNNKGVEDWRRPRMSRKLARVSSSTPQTLEEEDDPRSEDEPVRAYGSAKPNIHQECSCRGLNALEDAEEEGYTSNEEEDDENEDYGAIEAASIHGNDDDTHSSKNNNSRLEKVDVQNDEMMKLDVHSSPQLHQSQQQYEPKGRNYPTHTANKETLMGNPPGATAMAQPKDGKNANEEDNNDDDSTTSLQAGACPNCWSAILLLWRRRKQNRRTRRAKKSKPSLTQTSIKLPFEERPESSPSQSTGMRKSATLASPNNNNKSSAKHHSPTLAINNNEMNEEVRAEAAASERKRVERTLALRALQSNVWGEFMGYLENDNVEGIHRIAGRAEIQKALPLWRNSNGEGIIHVLCRNKGAKAIDAILSGLEPDVRQYCISDFTERGRGMLPLHVASAKGDEDCVRVLLKYGADALTPVDDYGLSALNRAAGNGFGGVCQILLEAGADPMLRDKAGFTAFHRACFHGHIEALKVLMIFEEDEYHSFKRIINADALLLARGRSALHYVAMNASAGSQAEELVRLLVHVVGMNINIRCREGRTPLHEASLSGNVYAVDALVRHGANVNERVLGSGSTPLHLAVENFQIGVCATLLQDPDVDLHILDDTGLSPEMLAVEESRYDILELFGSPEIRRARAKNLALRRETLNNASTTSTVSIATTSTAATSSTSHIHPQRSQQQNNIGARRSVVSIW